MCIILKHANSNEILALPKLSWNNFKYTFVQAFSTFVAGKTFAQQLKH